MVSDTDYIPVDGAMERFENHLLSHDRVILSAKFGDGKTFFLNKLKEKCKKDSKSPFEFITLYPVNYQVLENKDVFELIKHDMLLQMLQLRMIDTDYEVTDSLAFEFYVQTHFSSVAEFFLLLLTQVGADNAVVKALFEGFKTAKWLKNLRSKVDDFKKEVDQAAFIDEYLSKFDEKSIYENDAITKIIYDNISKYQTDNKRHVVLVIEDMDRLDPAHLFRIMNVFSAQMDYSYRNMCSNNDTLFENKFGVSNVVFVMNEDNAKELFHHFYGENVDYDGYMSKFYNKDIFYFSLAEEKERYALSLISKETGLREIEIREYFPDDFFVNKTMRKIVSAIDKVYEQFESLEVKPGVRPNPQLLKLFVIAKRLGVPNEDIISVVINHFAKIDHFYIDRLLPLIAQNPNTNDFEQVYVDGEIRGPLSFEIDTIKNDGMCSSTAFNNNYGNSNDNENISQRINSLLYLLGYGKDNPQ